MIVSFTDEEWQKILAFLKTCPNVYLGQEQKCRQFLEGLLWISQSGARWPALPAEYGDWRSIYKRFDRWRAKGVFKKLSEFCASDSELPHLLIESKIGGAHVSNTNVLKSCPFNLEEFKKRIEKGERTSEIAADLNLAEATIYYWLKKDGFKLPLSPKKKKPISCELLKKLYVENRLNVSAIQKKTGYSTKQIYYYLRRCGYLEPAVPGSSSKDKYNIDRNTLVDLYIHQNKTIPEIAQILKCTEMVVNRLLRKYGLSKIKRSTELRITTQSEDKEREPILRIISLVNSAKAVRYPSAAELAEKFGVTEETIAEDIAFAQNILRVPLKFSAEKQGYYVDDYYSFDDIRS